MPAKQVTEEQRPAQQMTEDQMTEDQMTEDQMTEQQRSARRRAIAQEPGKHGPARQRNPRGQGERLRDDIIEAASRLLADPAAPPLTLRGVARAEGVAPTSGS